VIDRVDWCRSWLAPLRALGEPVARRIAGGATVAQALDAAAAARGLARRFVPQSALPAGEAYEAFVARTGSVPTRDNLHDFFNGLIWLARPAWKAHLNRLQAAEIARLGVGAVRGPVRDALTLFDENGAWLDAPAPLVQALAARDWQRLFGPLRPQWAQARLEIFGHALLEQLTLAPRKALTAHVLAADPPALEAADWAAKPFLPLPVLGVPRWWTANETPGFYDDPGVFRPRRAPGPGGKTPRGVGRPLKGPSAP